MKKIIKKGYAVQFYNGLEMIIDTDTMSYKKAEKIYLENLDKAIKLYQLGRKVELCFWLVECDGSIGKTPTNYLKTIKRDEFETGANPSLPLPKSLVL